MKCNQCGAETFRGHQCGPCGEALAYCSVCGGDERAGTEMSAHIAEKHGDGDRRAAAVTSIEVGVTDGAGAAGAPTGEEFYRIHAVKEDEKQPAPSTAFADDLVGCIAGVLLYKVVVSRERWKTLQESPKLCDRDGRVVNWIYLGDAGDRPVIFTSAPEVFE